MGNTDELRHHDARTDGRTLSEIILPMVEMYETIEGEGAQAGFPTGFIRVFGCNLRCVWCDTPYSYAPAKAEQSMSVAQIVAQAATFRARRICLTGGEPLMYGDKSLALVQALAELPSLVDLHIETNGAIDLAPFMEAVKAEHVRYIMDWKLRGSNEATAMLHRNLQQLRSCDELKFVIADEHDFAEALALLRDYPCAATPLFSPVWETMQPQRLAQLVVREAPAHARLSLQLHKVIWDARERQV